MLLSCASGLEYSSSHVDPGMNGIMGRDTGLTSGANGGSEHTTAGSPGSRQVQLDYSGQQ